MNPIYDASVTLLNKKLELAFTIKLISSGTEKSILESPIYLQKALRILKVPETQKIHYKFLKIELGKVIGWTVK